jgi:hypothetical protein
LAIFLDEKVHDLTDLLVGRVIDILPVVIRYGRRLRRQGAERPHGFDRMRGRRRADKEGDRRGEGEVFVSAHGLSFRLSMDEALQRAACTVTRGCR